MKRALCASGCLIGVVLILCACATAPPTATPGRTAVQEVEAADAQSQAQVRALAWQALEPNTSSHDVANWEVIDLRMVEGREVVEEFENASAYGCPGPTPVPNAPVDASGMYWLVQFRKRPATPPPDVTPLSPTAPPNVPEPFIYEAAFLIDPMSDQVVARKLICVIY
jgi:hypothetical protein